MREQSQPQRVQPKNALRHLIRMRREGLGILHETPLNELDAAFWEQRLTRYVERLFPGELDRVFPRAPLPALTLEAFKPPTSIEIAAAEARNKNRIRNRLAGVESVIRRLSAFVQPAE